MDLITVKKEVFSDFLSLLQLKGEVENVEALININKESIKTHIVSSNKTVAIRGIFNGSFFISPPVGIDNISLLNQLVGSVSSEEINIKLFKNKLELTSPTNKMLAKCILKAPEYIINSLDEKKFDELKGQAVGNEFILSKENISKIVGYISILKSSDIVLEGKGKEVVVMTESNENEIMDTFELEGEVKEFKVKLGLVFKDLISSIHSDVVISINNEKPIYLNVKTDEYNIEYIVAPLK